MMMMMLFRLLVVTGLWAGTTGQNATNPPTLAPVVDQTIRDLIVNHPELTLFREALDSVGILEQVLDDETKEFTVFAPDDTAIQKNGRMLLVMKGQDENPPRWHNNLAAALNNHIVMDQVLLRDQIFDRTRTQVQSQQDVLPVSQWNFQVGLAPMGMTDIRATNGVLHIVEKVIKPEFFDNSFARLELQSEHGPDHLNRTSMVDVVDFVHGRETLQIVRESGTTYAGCRIRAFNRMGLDYLPQTVNGAKNVKYGELLNATFKQETLKNFVEYQLIPKNLYLNKIPNGFQELVTPGKFGDCDDHIAWKKFASAYDILTVFLFTVRC